MSAAEPLTEEEIAGIEAWLPGAAENSPAFFPKAVASLLATIRARDEEIAIHRKLSKAYEEQRRLSADMHRLADESMRKLIDEKDRFREDELRSAVLTEREACAKIADEYARDVPQTISTRIRARSKP